MAAPNNTNASGGLNPFQPPQNPFFAIPDLGSDGDFEALGGGAFTVWSPPIDPFIGEPDYMNDADHQGDGWFDDSLIADGGDPPPGGGGGGGGGGKNGGGGDGHSPEADNDAVSGAGKDAGGSDNNGGDVTVTIYADSDGDYYAQADHNSGQGDSVQVDHIAPSTDADYDGTNDNAGGDANVVTTYADWDGDFYAQIDGGLGDSVIRYDPDLDSSLGDNSLGDWTHPYDADRDSPIAGLNLDHGLGDFIQNSDPDSDSINRKDGGFADATKFGRDADNDQGDISVPSQDGGKGDALIPSTDADSAGCDASLLRSLFSQDDWNTIDLLREEYRYVNTLTQPWVENETLYWILGQVTRVLGGLAGLAQSNTAISDLINEAIKEFTDWQQNQVVKDINAVAKTALANLQDAYDKAVTQATVNAFLSLANRNGGCLPAKCLEQLNQVYQTNIRPCSDSGDHSDAGDGSITIQRNLPPNMIAKPNFLPVSSLQIPTLMPIGNNFSDSLLNPFSTKSQRPNSV